jgi:hypothetical protein
MALPTRPEPPVTRQTNSEAPCAIPEALSANAAIFLEDCQGVFGGQVPQLIKRIRIEKFKRDFHKKEF